MNVLKSICSKDGEWSCKRVIGLGGSTVIFWAFIYCTITHEEMPSATDFLFGGCITALGIEPLANAVNKIRDNKETNDQSQQ